MCSTPCWRWFCCGGIATAALTIAIVNLITLIAPIVLNEPNRLILPVFRFERLARCGPISPIAMVAIGDAALLERIILQTHNSIGADLRARHLLPHRDGIRFREYPPGGRQPSHARR